MAITKKKIPIKYTARDFNSIKDELISYAKRYYSNTFRDFNEASFGSLLLDLVAYIGDNLSFYLDYSVNETFLDTAIEYDNVIRLGKSLGYKFRGNPSSYGKVDLYVIIPANTTGLGPNPNYIPILKRGSEFSSTGGINFILYENVDFGNPNNEIVVAQVSSVTGLPTSYAIKSTGKILSGELTTQAVEIGSYKQFLRVEVGGSNVAEVISVTDTEGHSYYEVGYLSNNVIYKEIPNRGSDRDTVTSILKPIIVPRRFIVEQTKNGTFLQFGVASEDEIKLSSIADPSNLVLDLYGKDYTTSDSFDPARLNVTDKFGVVPANTTLTIVTRNNSSEQVNAASGMVTIVNSALFEFNNLSSLNTATVGDIRNSLEVTNSEPIVGDVTLPNTSELKTRIFDTFASQDRAVTKQDYISVIYRMPPSLGAVKRANIVVDNDSFKRNLNCYICSEDANGNLCQTNSTIKQNLKTHLTRFKMINDTISILNAQIVNLGINFVIVPVDESNRFLAVEDGTSLLKQFYNNKFDIGENFSITDVYTILKASQYIADVISVEIVNKVGGVYSGASYTVDDHTSSDGREIFCEEDTIFEIKYLDLDIRGSVR